MATIVISEFMDAAAVARLSARYATAYDPDLVECPAELASHLADARALIVRNRTQVRPELLDSAPALECVGRLGVGLDNIDGAACRVRGVAVYPATGANDLAVAEYVIASAMLLLRGAYRATAAVAAGEWPRQALIGRELSGKVMGLVGYGSIARETAKRAAALGMRCIAFDPYLDADSPAWGETGRRSLDQLLGEADVISLHVPLTDETRHMIDARAIERMGPGTIVVNAARGGVVAEAALVAALRQGKLAGAALDVFEHEPLKADAGALFSDIPNLLVTPHIAGVTQESNVRVSDLIANKVLDHLGEGA